MLARLAPSLLATVLWSGVAAAAIIDTNGDAVQVAPLANVVPPAGEEDGTIHAFDEQSGVSLTSDLTADMTVPYTTYNPPFEGPWDPGTTGRTLGTIPMNTVVDSHYIHFDPATFGGVIGSVTFDKPILAVICEGDKMTETAVNDPPGDTLGPSNYLGAGGTSYPDLGDLFGIEDGPDRVRLFESSIEVAFGAQNPGDRIRVLTDPSGTVLCGNGMLDPGEGCDDGNIDPGDGCFGCQPEICFNCTGEPSTCGAITSCTGGDGCCAPGCTPTTDTDCFASCTSKKVKLVGKKKACLLKCFEKGAKLGAPADAACLTRCASIFEFGFFKAELKGGCPTIGDAPALEAKVDAFVADVVSELDQAPQDDLNTCRARKLKCVGKYDRSVLTLYAKAAKIGFIDALKRTKFEVKLADCFAKAELDPLCETTGDLSATQAKDDTFITDAACELQVCL